MDIEGADRIDQYKWVFEHLLELRSQENKHYWDSFKMLLASQAGLLGFYVVSFDKLKAVFPIAIPIVGGFGFLFTIFMYVIIAGLLYWILHWQEMLKKIEGKLPVELRLFTSLPSRSDSDFNATAKRPWIRHVPLSIMVHLICIALLLSWALVITFSCVYVAKLP